MLGPACAAAFRVLRIPGGLDPIEGVPQSFRLARQGRAGHLPREGIAGEILQFPEPFAAPADVPGYVGVVGINEFDDIDAEIMTVVVQDVMP